MTVSSKPSPLTIWVCQLAFIKTCWSPIATSFLLASQKWLSICQESVAGPQHHGYVPEAEVSGAKTFLEKLTASNLRLVMVKC